jgi:hypothetical protein
MWGKVAQQLPPCSVFLAYGFSSLSIYHKLLTQMSQPDHSGDISHLMFSAMGHMEKQVCLQPGLAKTTSTMNSGTYEKYVRPPSPVMFSNRRDTSFSEAIKKPLPPPVLPQQNQSIPASKPGSSSRKNLTQTNTRVSHFAGLGTNAQSFSLCSHVSRGDICYRDIRHPY